ncbi:MAG: glycosyltransferase family 4 protein [Thermoleophilia bacterium]
MRVGLLSPVWFPVPPDGYGGIEWIVAILADGLVDAGHDVTLVAAGDSGTRARLVSVYPEAPSERIGQTQPELRHALAGYALAREGAFDVVSDHSGPLGAALAGTCSVPVLHTVHGALDGEDGEAYRAVVRVAPRVGLVSLSLNQRRPAPGLPWVANCPNAIDLDAYPYSPARGDYLLFVGRMGHDKGAHRAIEVARELGAPLLIAGKAREADERAYFEGEVRPRLGDGVEYLGEVDHARKVELLQGARATLFPIDWEEPFGLVMVESLACGTPVVATRRGAVPEVLEDGEGGIVVETVAAMAAAVECADAIESATCRRVAEERFGASRMVADYLTAFELALARGA